MNANVMNSAAGESSGSNLPRIDHIGIIVEDLEASAAAWSRMLPGAPTKRRSLPAVGLEVVEFQTANLIVELLAYTDAGEGIGRRVMGSAPGVNHLSLAVENLESTLDGLAEKGMKPQQGFPMQGAHGRIAFMPRDPVTGLLFEYCQPDAH